LQLPVGISVTFQEMKKVMKCFNSAQLHLHVGIVLLSVLEEPAHIFLYTNFNVNIILICLLCTGTLYTIFRGKERKQWNSSISS
jgi:hypothetical protein